MKAALVDIKRFLILILISLAIALLDLKNFFAIPKSILQIVTTPIQYGLYKTSSTTVKQFEFVIKSRTAAQEQGALKEQLSQILSENANLRRQLSELKAFEAQQQKLNPQTFNLVPARPVGFARFLKIDKGSEHGLKLNQAVVYKDNLIGEIISVSPKQSEIRLITDPDSKITAFVSNSDSKAKGLLVGQFGSEMLLDKVLHQEVVSEKDLVYSEGTEGKFPRGLILGQVTQVFERENEIFKQAKVKPVFGIGDLDLVFVIGE
ncbi:MAG: Rod shape-determining protein MreC [Candidatus Daviesbacteria bacterium GW2011_GWA2_38_24]|uniref:Cell shape-determining protein MreC n=1 Tax=Candidatus Daviesbacteria bacterium GW2011_GWA2_38_24 TaxID=1618422 RepID=A0A0G0JH19_9BACT|nr:MAG: Rod shape-determining protein MreC [Candidatus Daviesbacteria bacterium GW2011_GWA2_38_24]OGE23786.1 MAG: hypothetical protein A2688_03340 [Candidatus Daviesbacteria bacterium RIFCSPHIGHO2_01_FULL_38_8]